jgi:hypothetical protein
MNVIENEFHFLCECPGYELDRQTMYSEIANRINDFENMSDNNKLKYILKYEWEKLAKFLQNSWSIRCTVLYR